MQASPRDAQRYQTRWYPQQPPEGKYPQQLAQLFHVCGRDGNGVAREERGQRRPRRKAHEIGEGTELRRPARQNLRGGRS